jgi:mono/diheme cytochrome c family protein
MMVRRAAVTAGCLLAGAAVLGAAWAGTQPAPSGGLERTTRIADAAALGVGRLVPDLPIVGLDGQETTLSALLKGRRAVALCMTSATCPLSIKYGPRLAAMAEEYAAKGVGFVMVNVADAESRAQMREQARGLKWKQPYAPDADRGIRRALGPRTTTEVFVIDAARTLVYRGAVDDQYGIGTALDRPRREYLREALAAVLEERTPEIRATWAPGCIVTVEAAEAKPAPVTYFGRIARIAQDRCVVCHYTGGPAPFTLQTYESLVDRAAMVEAVVASGIMPPWGAAPPPRGQGSPWRHDRSLPPEERDDLLEWLRSDRPLGDPAEAPLARKYEPGWRLGTPDVLLAAPAVDVPAQGPMIHQRLVIDPGLKQDTWVRAIEILPRQRDVVHHALLFVQEPGDAIPGDAEGRGPIATYGAGYSTVEHRDGSAVRIPAGATLILHTYCRPMDKRMRESTRIGLHRADGPPRREVVTLAATAPDLVIPAGEAAAEATAVRTLEQDALLTALIPCLRSHGRAIRYDAVLPDGSEVPLLDVPSYDFKWRPRYELLEPLTLPAGTAIRCRAVFDNSAANPNNVDPDREVTAGWGADEEMLLGGFEIEVPVMSERQ